MLPIVHLRIGIENDDPERRDQQVAPPVVHDRALRQPPADQVARRPIHHDRASGRDVLDQRILEAGRPPRHPREGDRPQVLVDDARSTAVEHRDGRGMAVQRGAGPRQLVRVPHVVLVAERDVIGGAGVRTQQVEEAGHHAGVRRVAHGQLAAAGVHVQHLARGVARSVVARDDVEVRMSLRAQAGKQRLQEARAVVGRQENPGAGHDTHAAIEAWSRSVRSRSPRPPDMPRDCPGRTRAARG